MWGTEVGLSGNSSTAKGFSVAGLLDIAQSTGDTTVAVCVERIEGQGYACVAARVHFGAVQDRGDALIDDLRSGQGVGVEEVGALVGFVVTLNIPIAQRQLEGGLVGALATKLGRSGVDRCIHGLLDRRNRGSIGLRDN